MSAKGKLGILVGGGPAPGINGVIGAATIEAINNGLEVYGIYQGFKWLSRGDSGQVKRLEIGEVSRIHFQGGSVLRTARDNPTKSEKTMNNVTEALTKLGLGYLVTIGGDDTAFSASQVAAKLGGKLRVAHVPKTIDNDLPLPGNMPTFGFQTARHVGVGLVQNLMEDARTTSRWYLVIAMGRKAGHLALGIGKAAGATVTLIAEEFPAGKISFDQVLDVLEGAILKRRLTGRDDGVAVIAEGIAERFDEKELEAIPGVALERDEHNHIRLQEIPLGRMLAQRLEARFGARGEKMTIVNLDLGYELRCAPPIPYDCEYVRDLGWGAVQYVLSPQYDGGAIVCYLDGQLRPLPFGQMMDPATGRTRVRMVDVKGSQYQVALEYMIRLQQADLEDREQLGRLALEAQMEPEDFRQRFAAAAALPAT
ncbi:MAG: diphosphate--fructose-6-phosphate 1-phosphotransferase [Gemmatimonadota bacterium]